MRVANHSAQQQHLIGAEHFALPQHSIHKGGLPVIDVSNDGNVTDIHRGSSWWWGSY